MSNNQLLMPESLVEKSCQFGNVIHYETGNTIHVKGERKPGLSIVLDGRVSIGSYTISGRYQQRVTMTRGATFGEATLFNKVGRTHHAHAESDCSVVQLSDTQFHQFAAEAPNLIPFLLQSMSAKLNLALVQLDEIGRLPAEVRLAKLLYQLADDAAMVPLGQQQLADRVGVTVLACHNALKKLETRGVIQCGYGKVNIVKPEALADILQQYDVAL